MNDNSNIAVSKHYKSKLIGALVAVKKDDVPAIVLLAHKKDDSPTTYIIVRLDDTKPDKLTRDQFVVRRNTNLNEVLTILEVDTEMKPNLRERLRTLVTKRINYLNGSK